MTVETRASQVEAALCPNAYLRRIVEGVARHKPVTRLAAEAMIKRRCQQAGFRNVRVTAFIDTYTPSNRGASGRLTGAGVTYRGANMGMRSVGIHVSSQSLEQGRGE